MSVGCGGSALLGGRGRGLVGKSVGLIDDVCGDGLEGIAVLACVVSAEEELTAAQQLDPEVGLGPAAVASVSSAQRGGAWGNGSGHFGLISSHGD
jgi:hypothetical protein